MRGMSMYGDGKMHKVFGQKEETAYIDRRGAYLIPIQNGQIGVVQTDKGYFLLGGGLDHDESDEACIERECMEEAGYRVSVKNKIGSAEAYYKAPKIGYFHPIQTYYAGELIEKICEPTEEDHTFIWINYEDLRGRMYMEMQNWAIEEGWKAG